MSDNNMFVVRGIRNSDNEEMYLGHTCGVGYFWTDTLRGAMFFSRDDAYEAFDEIVKKTDGEKMYNVKDGTESYDAPTLMRSLAMLNNRRSSNVVKISVCKVSVSAIDSDSYLVSDNQKYDAVKQIII